MESAQTSILNFGEKVFTEKSSETEFKAIIEKLATLIPRRFTHILDDAPDAESIVKGVWLTQQSWLDVSAIVVLGQAALGQTLSGQLRQDARAMYLC